MNTNLTKTIPRKGLKVYFENRIRRTRLSEFKYINAYLLIT